MTGSDPTRAEICARIAALVDRTTAATAAEMEHAEQIAGLRESAWHAVATLRARASALAELAGRDRDTDETIAWCDSVLGDLASLGRDWSRRHLPIGRTARRDLAHRLATEYGTPAPTREPYPDARLDDGAEAAA